jgi:DNA-binding transcriptional ArsR family regulator
MKEGPNIATIGALVGDPARANILTALMSGQALTATELAAECGVTRQTVSAHLSKLENGGLIGQQKQGRHRYFSLSGEDVGHVLESLMGLAASRGHLRVRTGPKDPELRKARICYDHLAGTLGVQILDAFLSKDFIYTQNDDLKLTPSGHDFMIGFGIDLTALEVLRRPLCKYCLDWSARRNHLAGSLGAAILSRIIQLKWAKRHESSRIINFSRRGETEFLNLFQPSRG